MHSLTSGESLWIQTRRLAPWVLTGLECPDEVFLEEGTGDDILADGVAVDFEALQDACSDVFGIGALDDDSVGEVGRIEATFPAFTCSVGTAEAHEGTAWEDGDAFRVEARFPD